MRNQQSSPARLGPWLWLVVPAAWLWRGLASPFGVWAWPGGRFSDLLITHLSNAEFVHQSLTFWHQLPLWNPTILSGLPTVGDPLAGMWYPPLWSTIIFPTPIVFNALVWLHVAWAGWGFYRLARAEGLTAWPAGVAGLVFSGTPKLIGQAALGHVTLVMAVAWTPWWLLSLSREAEGDAQPRWSQVWRGARAGSILGLIFLADPRWLIPSLGLGGAFTVRRWLAEGWQRKTLLRHRVVGWIAAAVQAGLIASVLALPMWQLVGLSTRRVLSASDSAAFSLPAAHLIGILIPDLGGWPEWLTYIGLSCLCLAATAALLRARGWQFWGLVALSGWVLALGDHTPVYPLLTRFVPGLAWQRVPARFLFLTVAGMAMLAGCGFQSLQQRADTGGRVRWLRRAAFAWTVLFTTIGVVGGLAGGSWIPGNVRWDLGLAGAAGGLAGLGVLLFRRLSRTRWLAGAYWVGLIVVELASVNGTLVEVRPLPQVSSQTALADSNSAAALVGDRLFSPSYSVPQAVAAENRLQLADGVNPLQLASYWTYMSNAVGFDPSQYSVTLPPFSGGDPSAQRPWHIDAQKLGWLNVQQVVASYPLSTDGLEFEAQQGGRYFYLNQEEAPRAWVQEGAALDLATSGTQADVTFWSPNAIQVVAGGPGRLVLSEIAYPGWGATVDGVAQPVQQAGGLLRSVVLGPGKHTVEFAFLPAPALWGAALTVVGLALAALAWSKP